MAWRSSGATNEALITNLVKNKLIRSDRVKDAMLRVGLRVFDEPNMFMYDNSR